jgi:hypothetical protein
MGIELVNGFVCRDCADVALAKRGIDPAKPEKPGEAETSGKTSDGINRPLAAGERGTNLNLTA